MNPSYIEIVKRMRAALTLWNEYIVEKRMFGGNCFLYDGKMCVGETKERLKERLMVRVVSEKIENILQMLHVLPMDFTKKPMKEFIFVTERGFDTELKLQKWIELSIEHAIIKSKK